MTAESRTIRKGEAKRIYYAWGNHGAEFLQRILDGTGQPILAVQVDTLVKAFQVAVDRYVEASEQDPELNRRINARLDKIFTNMEVPTK